MECEQQGRNDFGEGMASRNQGGQMGKLGICHPGWENLTPETWNKPIFVRSTTQIIRKVSKIFYSFHLHNLEAFLSQCNLFRYVLDEWSVYSWKSNLLCAVAEWFRKMYLRSLFSSSRRYTIIWKGPYYIAHISGFLFLGISKGSIFRFLPLSKAVMSSASENAFNLFIQNGEFHLFRLFIWDLWSHDVFSCPSTSEWNISYSNKVLRVYLEIVKIILIFWLLVWSATPHPDFVLLIFCSGLFLIDSFIMVMVWYLFWFPGAFSSLRFLIIDWFSQVLVGTFLVFFHSLILICKQIKLWISFPIIVLLFVMVYSSGLD